MDRGRITATDPGTAGLDATEIFYVTAAVDVGAHSPI
jgi:hypothetical protein